LLGLEILEENGTLDEEQSKKKVAIKAELFRGCLFTVFVIFFISFQEIQKLDGPKSGGVIQFFDLLKANPRK
jgi:hypothetical protein